MVKKLRPFSWMVGFCLLVELHREGSACSRVGKKSQILGWLVTHGSKWCVYTKRMFCENFRIVEKKFAKCSTYLVYNWIYNSKNLQKIKTSFWALKLIYMSSYVTHIYRGTNITSLFDEKKISLIHFFFYYLRFMIFAVTVELHCNGKNIKSQINLIFLDESDFFQKETGLVWSSSICGWYMSSYKRVLVPKLKILGFWRFLSL